MAKKKFPFKDPDEDLDYTLDWSDRVGTNDAILSSVWSIVTQQSGGLSPDVALSLHSESIIDGEISDATVGTVGTVVTNGATLVWLRGGEIAHTYELLNRVQTVGARIMDQTVYIPCKKR